MKNQPPDTMLVDGFDLMMRALQQMYFASLAIKMTPMQEMMRLWTPPSAGARAIDHVDVSLGGQHRVIHATFPRRNFC